MTRHDDMPHGARYIDEQGRTVVTDGGTAAVPGAGVQGPAETQAAANMAGGTGFEQFVAQSRLARATARGDETMQANAAQQVYELRANSQLRKDEWKSLDERLIEVAQRELVIVNDLRSAGLTINEDLSTLLHEFEKTNEFDDADVNMNAETSGTENSSDFSLHSVPLPIVSKQFHIKRRKLLASRQRGQDLSTINQSKAARKVSEGLDSLVFNGWGSQFDGASVPGLLTHEDRNTVTGMDWTDDGTDADDIRADVLSVVEAIENDNYGGDLWGYFGRSAWQTMRRKDTDTDQERSVLERLTNEFGDTINMRMAPTMPEYEAVFFRPVEDVIELAVAADMQNVEWDDGDGMKMYMKVMGSITPVIRSDEKGQMGVGHLTGLDAA